MTDKYYFTNYVCAEEKVTNRQFLYNNANLITYLRGINTTQLGEMMISTASSLLQLDISNSTQLTSLTLTGLNSLRYLNCSYCPFGGSGSTNSLNLSDSTALQEVDISYSGITNMTLPTGGTLKKINASNTKITKIKVVTQTMLEELDLSNCGDLAELELTKCDSLKRVIITNSALTNVTITGCPSLEEVLLSDNKRLSQVSFEGCDNIKVLDLSGCTLSNFASYTGDEQVDAVNALNLIGCPNLEELRLVNCSAQVIRFSNNCTELKTIKARQSKWIQTVITSDTTSTFGTYLVNGEICPSIDLGNFASLESIDFQSNAYVQTITNLTYSGNGSGIFRYCTALKRITGHITINNSNSNMFGDMSSAFRLNGVYPNMPTRDNVETMVLPLKISIATGTTALSSTFYNNWGVNLYDAYYICALLPTTVTHCEYTFYGNRLQQAEYTSESLSPTLLQGATGLTHTTAMFMNAGLKGTFPSTVLNGLTNLAAVASMFENNSFTQLDSQFGSSLFSGLKKLVTCSGFLCTNPSLKSQSSSAPIQLSELFKDNPELVSCSYFLGVYATVLGSTQEDQHMNYQPRRAIYINFGTNGDELFANNPKLTSCAFAFPKCTAQGVMHENIFGGVNPNKMTSGATGFYSTKLTSVEFCFHDSNVSTTLTTRLFANQPELTSVAGFVSGGLY